MTPNVLLMDYPWLDRESHHYSVYQIYGAYPNPALAILGGNLRKQRIPFDIYDAKIEDSGIGEALARVEALRPDVICLSAFTSDVFYANQWARLVKDRLPDCRVVVGGPHSSVMPRHTLDEFPWFDIAVKGEGEYVLVDIIRALSGDGDLSGVPNIVYRQPDGGIAENLYDASYEVHDLDGVGIPVWDMLPTHGTQYQVLFARGCPFPCQFCYRLTGTTFRHKNADTVLEELDMIYRIADPEYLFIADPTFGLNKKKTFAILDAIVERGYSTIRWKTQARVSTTTEEMLVKMKNAGCTSIFFGIESGEKEIQLRAKQNIDIDQAQRTLRICRGLGIETLGGFIFGHIGDTRESVFSTARLATRMAFDKIVIGIMVPWPGTEVYNRAMRDDSEDYELVSKDWRDFDKHFGSSIRFKKFPDRFLPRLRLLTYVGFYLRQLRLWQLARDVAANLDVLGRFAWASIFGASRKVDRRTELQEYLETERPDLLAEYREGSAGAGHRGLERENKIRDGKWVAAEQPSGQR